MTTLAIKRALGDAIKAMDSNRVGGYLVRFTNAADTDLYDEYFTADTDLATELGWKLEGKPILVEHGFDGTFKAMSVGVFDFSRIDDVGLYVEGKLKDREEYEEMLRELRANGKVAYSDEDISHKANIAVATVKALLDTGKVQWSSGALPQAVEVDRAGHIKTWPIIEGSMTVTPAEPDGTEVETIRSAMKQLEHLLSIQTSQDTQEPIEVANPKRPQRASSGDNVERGDGKREKPKSEKAIKDMELQEIKDALDELRSAVNTIVEGVTADGEEPVLSETEVEEVQAELEETIEGLETDEQEEIDVEALAEKAFAIVQKRVAKKQKNQKAIDKAVNKQVLDWQKRQPPIDGLPAYDEQTQRNISVSEELRFMNYDAVTMALVVKMKLSAYDPMMRESLTLGDVIPDESFINHLKMKIAQEIETRPFTGRDASAMKAILPFKSMKADELMATDITAQGTEWLSTFYVMQSWRDAEEDNQLLNLLRARRMQSVTVPRGVNQVEFKTTDKGSTLYMRGEPNSLDATGRPEITVNPSSPVTGNITKTLEEHVVAVVVSHRLELQSLLQTAAEIQWDTAQALGEGLESAIINGDTRTAASTNINLIDDTPATGLQKPLYLAWNGLRYEPLVTVAAQRRDGGALSSDDYLNTLALFPHKIQARVRDLLFVIDPKTKNATRKLTDIKTKDVAGDENTLFTGQIPDLFDVEVYTSAQLALSNSAGKIPAAGGTLGQIMAIYAPFTAYGRQQDIIVESQRDILSGATTFVSNIYHVFMTRQANSTMLSYNLTV